MFQTLFQDGTLLTWPIVGLLIFVLAFVAVLFYAIFGLRDRANREYLSSLPLRGETTNPPRDSDGRTC